MEHCSIVIGKSIKSADDFEESFASNSRNKSDYMGDYNVNKGGQVTINLADDGCGLPWIHIRQVRMELGVLQVNNDGLIIHSNQFAALMQQLRGIECALMTKKGQERISPLHQTPKSKATPISLPHTTRQAVEVQPSNLETAAINSLRANLGIPPRDPDPSNISPTHTYLGIHRVVPDSATASTSTQILTSQQHSSEQATETFEQRKPANSGAGKRKKLKKVVEGKKGAGDKRKKYIDWDISGEGEKGVDLTELMPQARRRRLNPDSDDISLAFATILHGHIEELIKNRCCIGCILNVSYDKEGHDVCQNSGDYVEQFFEEAMTMLDDGAVQDELSRLDPAGVCPSKTAVQGDRTWCKLIQDIIVKLC